MITYFINVIGSEAFLTAGKSLGRWGLFSHEKWFERHHTGTCE